VSLTPFYDEQQVEASGDKLILAVDFRAIDCIEHLAGGEGRIMPMPEVITQLFASPPSFSLSGKVLWALLRRHHEAITLDEAAGQMFGCDGGRIGAAMGELLLRAMNLGEAEGKDKNPPKPRGASKTS